MTRCVALCVLSLTCKSVNFCGGRVCELNEFGYGDDYAEPWPDCMFRGMRVNTMPVCSEINHNDTLKDIQDDKNPGLCKINGKRIDAQLTKFMMIGLPDYFGDNSTMYRQHCLPASHGGVVACSTYLNSNESALLSVHSRSVLKASDAAALCNSKNYYLWDGIDWLLSEIELLAERFDGFQILLAVSDKNSEGIWLKSNGQDVTNLITWRNGVSNNEESLDQLMADGSLLRNGNVNAFYAANELEQHHFACVKTYPTM